MMMKGMIHLLNLDILYDTFPDGCFVFCHRPIRNVVPSYLALLRLATANYQVAYDEKWIERALHILRTLTEKAVR